MVRQLLLSVGSLVLVLSAASWAQAQPTPPGGATRPSFSPYMNLLRGGSPALNYFGLVRPQQQFQQQFGNLQQQLSQTNNNLQSLNNNMLYGVDPTLPLTGHAATFNNTGRYFNNNPANGGGFGGSYGGGMGNRGGTGMGSLPRAPGMGGGGASRPSAGGSGAIRR